jgi:arylsulfatase A-like enzyme
MISKNIAVVSFPLIAGAISQGCTSGNQNDGEKTSQRPNIIFIMSDDHAEKAISAYDTSLIQTPNIDRIAENGMRFTNSFVANSISAPSRAVMLTGKHSHINGMRDNLDRFDSSQMTFPKLLQDSGYYTAMIGKWHLASEPTGFDYWNILDGQGNYYNPDLIEMGETKRHEGYVTDIITDIAIETIEKRDTNKPFCLLYHHKAPHRAWFPDTTDLYKFSDVTFPVPKTFFDEYKGRKAAEEADMRIKDMFLSMDLKLKSAFFDEETGTGGAPEGWDAEKYANIWRDRFNEQQLEVWDEYYDSVNREFKKLILSGKDKAKWMYQRYMQDYLKCILSVDRNIGRLLDYLKENNLLENTLIVYTSDQGFYLGEHGWYDKRFMYEESFRTPLIMSYPKEIEAGSVSNQLVQNIDYAPTFLDIAGVKIPDEIQGKSLRPLWQKEKVNDWREALYYQYFEYPHGWHSVHKHYGIRTKRYKLIHFPELEVWELYDLKNDPYEMNNLYTKEKYATLADSLKTELNKLQTKYKVDDFDE